MAKRKEPYIKDGVANEFIYVPMAKAELSAGGGAVVTSEELGEKYAFRKKWAFESGLCKGKVVLMTVRGDSMEPTFKDGDTVLVDMARIKLISGCIYAMGTDDMLQIKRLERRGKGVRVISDNSRYEPYDAAPDEVRIIGQVVWYARQIINPEHNGD